jgi:hypothetical protein
MSFSFATSIAVEPLRNAAAAAANAALRWSLLVVAKSVAAARAARPNAVIVSAITIE